MFVLAWSSVVVSVPVWFGRTSSCVAPETGQKKASKRGRRRRRRKGETNGGSNVWEEFVAYLRFGSTLTPLYAFNSPSFFLAISILIPDRCLHCNKEWLKKRRERRQVNKIEIGRCHRWSWNGLICIHTYHNAVEIVIYGYFGTVDDGRQT